ncbi:hypothetical protein crov253 [Cafeteria roenbergensis virus]|uniref:Uncharacterized protein n=1 Tax=Cafeteria roenbergensis virus (strain BV-PW1) TaxID=693272 RepID=E3T523_CROVB|nr:hypothetical protein crov253 [Cafeteria roenbergensis virus BV-PW1]ADO67286.1 hypothetical protein crov253 [Cafeteria roenbergensis virus BV-PW1]
MRFVIVQPSWDHSEILTSLLYFIKNNNHQVKIIYDWSHPEGNYLDYLCNLNGFDDSIKINYKSPKFHVKNLQNAHKIIFVDEIHLKKFLSKQTFRNMIHKMYTFNHITKKINWDIKVLNLGLIPFNRCINTNKFLVNNLYNPQIDIKYKLNPIKKYLIVGNPSYRELSFLEKLNDNLNIEINFVVRKPLEINKPFLKIHQNLSTTKLIEMIRDTDFILTLFKTNSVYHKDRISGIIPFAISFGKPIITDKTYNDLTKSSNNLIYTNTFDNFKNIIDTTINMSNNTYSNLVKNIIKYRDNKIIEQYLNFNLIFN